jgi:Holliday junction resolvasome RuvABC endonuclease subunit
MSVSAPVEERCLTGSFTAMANNAFPTTPLRTLALDPGTREMGYAVLESTDLLYFGVHTFPHRCSARRLCDEGQRFAQGLLDAYAPQLLVVEKTWYAKSKRSTRLHVFVEAMEGFAHQQGLLVRAYTPRMVKKMICGHGDATRRDIAETLIRQRYLYLAKYLQRDLRTRDKYWQSMFDAVALGLTGYEEVSRTQVALPVVRKHRDKKA